MTEDHLLDPRLESDTLALGETALCSVRLARDGRWPWIILVPKRADVTELHELPAADLSLLITEIALVSETLKRSTGCLKVNVAAIGNLVRQLHVHVVARDEDDAAWPGPIWGVGTPELRSNTSLPEFASEVQQALSLAPPG